MNLQAALALKGWRDATGDLLDVTMALDRADAHFSQIEPLLCQVRTLMKDSQAVESRLAVLVNRQQEKAS